MTAEGERLVRLGGFRLLRIRFMQAGAAQPASELPGLWLRAVQEILDAFPEHFETWVEKFFQLLLIQAGTFRATQGYDG